VEKKRYNNDIEKTYGEYIREIYPGKGKIFPEPIQQL